MGANRYVGFSRWPDQANEHRRVRVCFDRDTANQMGGKIVRDDATEPFVTIIKLDDGRFVLSTECQYTLE